MKINFEVLGNDTKIQGPSNRVIQDIAHFADERAQILKNSRKKILPITMNDHLHKDDTIIFVFDYFG